MNELSGWLLDLYADPQDGLTLWLLGDDGKRRRLRQDFPVTFYAAGAPGRLQALERFLRQQSPAPALAREQRRDLFLPAPVNALAVRTRLASDQPYLFQQVSRQFPDLTYYDADVHMALRHAAACGSFPLARCQVQAAPDGAVRDFRALDTPWDLDPQPPPLRVMELAPDADPFHAVPQALCVRTQPGQRDERRYHFPLSPARPLLVNLRALLLSFDPDLLLTDWGDTWLLPRLLALSEELNIHLPLNRAAGREPAHKAEHTYFSYGQIVYRGSQVLLLGRWHVDRRNALLWGDYAIEGVLEAARVTGLPVQDAARLSPGTGISSMQIRTALSQGILVPWRKQQVEHPKTALDLIHVDQGGLVYQPILGVHSGVGAIDFISMYPSIMVRCNISPETTPRAHLEISTEKPGLVPQTLGPLLEKRVALKHRLASLPAWHPRKPIDAARSSAQKWLLVTCFGYLGYKNARFGQIEAHEAVTRYGRESLLRAKEAAEDAGFSVLQMYVDGLWLHRPGKNQPADFEPLLVEIAQRTGLPIALDGVYRWVAFLPSRANPRVPVPNRYFGAFQDGSLKVRGLACRRRDTPTWVANLQTEIIRAFAPAPDGPSLGSYLPAAREILRKALAELQAGRVPPRDLLVGQKLTRELDRYVSPSPAAQAAEQLARLGKTVRPGQRVRFLRLRGGSVHAWDLPTPPDPRSVDTAYYRELALRAAGEVIEGLGFPLERPPATLFSATALARTRRMR